MASRLPHMRRAAGQAPLGGQQQQETQDNQMNYAYNNNAAQQQQQQQQRQEYPQQDSNRPQQQMAYQQQQQYQPQKQQQQQNQFGNQSQPYVYSQQQQGQQQQQQQQQQYQHAQQQQQYPGQQSQQYNPAQQQQAQHYGQQQQQGQYQQQQTPNYSSNHSDQQHQEGETRRVSQTSGGSTQNAPQRKSSKIVSDSIPHPVMSWQESISPKEYIGSENISSNAPFSFQYFTEKDMGNAGPKFIRPTVYRFATEPNIMNQLQIPQGCIIQPFADSLEGVPVVQPIVIESSSANITANINNDDKNNNNPQAQQQQSSNSVIFRCTRCHAYVNPFFKYIDGGNTAVCNICSKASRVPAEYFSPLAATGERMDKQSRPELSKGVYDMVAPANYPKKQITQNYITVCLELTLQSVQSGVFAQALFSIQSSLASIPAQARTSLSICTYNSTLSFYSIPKDLSNDPQTIVVADLDDPFSPFPKSALFLNLQNDKDKIDYLIEKLQKQSETLLMGAQSQQPDQKQLPTKQVASIASIVSSIESMLDKSPARIIVFASQLSSIGLGKLKRREDSRLMGTDNEKNLYIPQCKVYSELSQLLVKQSISVDLFMFSQQYCDLATVQTLCTETGGNIYYFPHYSPADAEKIHYDLFRNLTRSYATECIMTLRTSPGIILEDFLTPKGKIPVRDLSISSLHADSVIGVAVKQEEKITSPFAHLQYACLYTNQEGVNMIRVINLALPVTNSISELFKVADLDAALSLLLRKNLMNIATVSLKNMQQALLDQLVSIFYSYRNNCAASSSPSQLILPESIKFLIVMVLSVLKSEVFKTQSPQPDSRIYEIYRFVSYPANQLTGLLYPRVYPIHSLYNDEDSQDSLHNRNSDSVKDTQNLPGTYLSEYQVSLPSTIPASLDRLSSFGIYLIDNGETIYLYVMKDADSSLIESLFGVQDYEQIRDIQQFPALQDTDYAQRVNAIIDQLRRNKNGGFQNIKIVLYKDPFEQVLKSLFVEDEIRGVMSYNNFICDMHKRIQQKYTS